MATMQERRRAAKVQQADNGDAPKTKNGNSSILLEQVESIPKNLKLFIHGATESGKTLLASGVNTEPWPPELGTVVDDVLFCDADGGMTTLASQGVFMQHKHPAEGRFSTVAHMEQIPNIVKKTGGINTVSIDTITRFQESLLLDRMKNYSFQIQDWGYLRNVFLRSMSQLLDLGCNLVVTAHTEEKEDETLQAVRVEDPFTKQPVMRHPERYLPVLQGAFRNLIHGFFDVVGFYRLEWERQGGQLVPVRKLYTRPTQKWMARSRIAFLPEEIVNPSLPKILAHYQEAREKLIATLKTKLA